MVRRRLIVTLCNNPQSSSTRSIFIHLVEGSLVRAAHIASAPGFPCTRVREYSFGPAYTWFIRGRNGRYRYPRFHGRASKHWRWRRVCASPYLSLSPTCRAPLFRQFSLTPTRGLSFDPLHGTRQFPFLSKRAALLSISVSPQPSSAEDSPTLRATVRSTL